MKLNGDDDNGRRILFKFMVMLMTFRFDCHCRRFITIIVLYVLLHFGKFAKLLCWSHVIAAFDKPIISRISKSNKILIHFFFKFHYRSNEFLECAD